MVDSQILRRSHRQICRLRLPRRGWRNSHDAGSHSFTIEVALGWTDADGCHVEPTLTRLGFEVRGDIRGYWTADSIALGYGCPTCGSPCLCAARLFALA